MKNKVALLFLAFIIVTQGCSGLLQMNQDRLEFHRQKLFETKPWQKPLNFPLHLSYNYDVENRFRFSLENRPPLFNADGNTPVADNTNRIPSTSYFWALNSGNLIFLNEQQETVYELDYKEGRWLTTKLDAGFVYGIRRLSVGPGDQIYVSGTANANSDKSGFYSVINRYVWQDNMYVRDYTFKIDEGKFVPQYLRISPDNWLYAFDWDMFSSRIPSVRVFDEFGHFVKFTAAEGKTISGLEFNFKNTSTPGTDVVSVIQMDLDGNLYRLIPTAQFGGYNFKSTFNDYLIVYGHRANNNENPSGYRFQTDLPFVVALDLKNGHSVEIDLGKCRKRGYKYFNVADISINYKAEIYALVVYFNTPGVITGDERIILYRWSPD